MNHAERTRQFFASLIGRDKPFKNRSRMAEYLGMKTLPKQTKFFKFLDGADSSFANVTEWLDRLGGTVVLPDETPADFASYYYIPKVEAIAGAGASLETSAAVTGYYAFRSDFLGKEHISESHSVLMDVRGDSMEPLFFDGDTLLVDQSDIQILDGRIYVITLGDELRVKHVQKTFHGLLLRSENTRYADIVIEGPDLEQFKVHGRVRWCGKLVP